MINEITINQVNIKLDKVGDNIYCIAMKDGKKAGMTSVWRKSAGVWGQMMTVGLPEEVKTVLGKVLQATM